MSKFIDRTGETFTNNQGCNLKIIVYRSNKDCDIEFEDGTILQHLSYRHIQNGLVKNYNLTNSLKGFVGYGKFKATNELITLYYDKWYSVFQRCYSKKHLKNSPTYKDVTVCEEWHNFQNFAQWMEDNFKLETMQGWHLDKDILVKGNKVYSPETCCFVPAEMNIIFAKKSKRISGLPIGVKVRGKRFRALLRKFGTPTYMGTFDTPEEASQAYKQAKEEYIKEVADKWKDLIDPRVYEALYNYKVEITD